MTDGIVFDIREFTLHDGPGIRTTVFLKGCPLACMWCHNPEGLSKSVQVMQSPTSTRLVGTIFSPQQLARLLSRQAAILKVNEGGVTFSGGEPLLQAHFVAEVIDLLDDLHVVLDTSGYGREQDFRMLLERVDLVYYDLKLIDPEAHRYYTGSSNQRILRNLQVLSTSGVPFVIRVPLVPGVTDTRENLSAIARTAQTLPGLLQVNLLPYNQAAGAKYKPLGMEFTPTYDEASPVNIQTDCFDQFGVKVSVA
ncbi:MAG TPA: radical SAM protein [Anaerolineales bacterium]|nr:radical SAM protein [Anaerolineales bacterium]